MNYFLVCETEEPKVQRKTSTVYHTIISELQLFSTWKAIFSLLTYLQATTVCQVQLIKIKDKYGNNMKNITVQITFVLRICIYYSF